MRGWTVLLVCLVACGTLVEADEPQMVFDLFNANAGQGEQPPGEAIVTADARDLHKDQAEVKPSVRIAAALVVWSEGIAPATDHSLFRIATHPSVEASLRMDITSIHRARSAAIHSVLHHIEQELAVDSTQEPPFTHILLVSQDVDFTVEDLDALIAAKVPIAAGVGLTKHAPYFPNFIPSFATASTALAEEGTMKALNSFETPEEYRELHETVLNHFGEGPIEALAMSYDFVLFEAAALFRIARRTPDAHEWFWESAKGRDIYMHSVGDCTRLSQTIRGKTKEEKVFNLAMEVPATNYMEDQDLCFSALAKRYGFKLHVLPHVQYGRTVPVRLSLSAWKDDITHASEKNLLDQLSFPHEAFVVQNKLADKAAGRTLVQVGMETGKKVVIATPVWGDLNSQTAECIYNLAQQYDIIGRVAITHEELSFARNALVRKVFEEFGDEATHILFIDSDMVFTPVDYIRLALVDEAIVMGLAVKRNAADNPPAYMPVSGVATNFEPLISALTVDPAPPIPIQAGGMAFTLVRMDVFEELGEWNDATQQTEWFWTEHIVDEESHRERNLSEDYSFCMRAGELGFRVFLHPAAQLRHLHAEGKHIGDWLRAGGLIE